MDYLGFIEQTLQLYTKYNINYTFTKPTINENTKKEYYKNGNVKAYISYLYISNSYTAMTVKNRDYNLYKQNVYSATQYLKLVYFAYQYERVNEALVSYLNKFHLINYKKIIKIDEIIRLKQKEVDSLECIKFIDEEMDQPIKPNKFDNLYLYKKRFFYSLFHATKKQIKSLHSKLDRDTQNYQKKLNVYYEKKHKVAINNYMSIINYNNHLSMKENEIKVLSEFPNNMQNMKDEKTVLDYFDIIKINDLEYFYNNLDLQISFHADSSSIICNLELPCEEMFPKVKSYKVYKTYIEYKENLYSDQERRTIIENSINSYILFYLIYFNQSNINNTFKRLYINLFKYNLNSNNKFKENDCVWVFNTELNGVGIEKELSARELIEKILGKAIFLKDLENEHKPIKKDYL